jgi:hypothetical protein
MRVHGLALAGVLVATCQTAALADQQRGSRAPGPVASAGQATVVGSRSHPAPGFAGQWTDGWHRPGWPPNRQFGGPPVYWVWVPGSAVFDYPFADWRGPTGGWGNP